MTKDTKYYAKILAKIAIAISALIGIFLTYLIKDKIFDKFLNLLL